MHVLSGVLRLLWVEDKPTVHLGDAQLLFCLSQGMVTEFKKKNPNMMMMVMTRVQAEIRLASTHAAIIPTIHESQRGVHTFTLPAASMRSLHPSQKACTISPQNLDTVKSHQNCGSTQPLPQGTAGKFPCVGSGRITSCVMHVAKRP